MKSISHLTTLSMIDLLHVLARGSLVRGYLMDFAVASFPDLVNVDFIFAGPYSPLAVVHIGRSCSDAFALGRLS